MAIIFENDAELRSVKTNSSIIPEYSLSIMEDALYVAEAIEMADKACSECIGINELNIYESTGELVSYNEADEEAANSKWNLKDLKDTLIRWAKNLWKAIKTFFGNIVKRFDSLAKKVDGKIKGFAKNQINKIPDGASFGEVYNFAEFDKFPIDKFCNNALDFAKELSSKAESIEDLKNAADEVLKKVTGEDVDSLASFKNNLFEKLCGDKVKADKAWLSSNLESLKNDVCLIKARQATKKLYVFSRKIIDEYMSDIKKIDGNKAEVFVATKVARTQIVSCMNTCNSAILNIYTRKQSQARIILAKAILGINKKPVKEAVEDTVVDQQSIIESLFAF